MPGVQEDLARIAVDAQHSDRLAVTPDVDSVVPVEGVGLALGLRPRQVDV